MELNVSLKAFEGPLDLLLHLIEKNKVDIYDIPIGEITDQYLEYIQQIRQEDLDTMSEFLVMAATLSDIKSRMLLPKDPEQKDEKEDPRETLVSQLIQYKMCRYVAQELQRREEQTGQVACRKESLPEPVRKYQTPVDLNQLTKGISLQDLRQTFLSVMRRSQDRRDPVRSEFGTIQREKVSLEEAAGHLKEYALCHRYFEFENLLTQKPDRMSYIVTFLAVLEFMKNDMICIRQEHLFGEIRIRSLIYRKSADESMGDERIGQKTDEQI